MVVKTQTKNKQNANLILRIGDVRVQDFLGESERSLETRANHAQIRQVLFIVDVLIGLEFAQRNLIFFDFSDRD